MKRLEKTFEKLKKENKKAFSIFLTAGFPDYETSLELMHLSVDKGVDFLEIGMPFSDPSADGPIIKTAGTYALEHGATIKKTIELIKEFRKTDKTTPLVWMGYFNSIFNYGASSFVKDIEQAGVDGLLAVDLPPEEFYRIGSIKETNLDLIRLVTPVTSPQRIETILKDASGFIYFVSIAGITGTKEAKKDPIKEKVEYLKTRTSLPVLVGFGIKDANKAREISSFCDGTIVGSAVISRVLKYISNGVLEDKTKMLLEVGEFLAGFKKG